MRTDELPSPGALICVRFNGIQFVHEEDSQAGIGDCTLEAFDGEPLLVTYVENGNATLGAVHIMHPSGWSGWRTWSETVAPRMRQL